MARHLHFHLLQVQVAPPVGLPPRPHVDDSDCWVCSPPSTGRATALSTMHVEVSLPSPKKDEVLIKVEAVSLNPADWKIQNGMFRPFIPFKLPFIPGTDVAGEIVDVGSGVTTLEKGDKVLSMLPFVNGGGLAQHTIGAAKLTVKRPPQLPAADASGLCMAGLTALAALDSAGIKLDGSDKPANILITAASGGVGHYAVQLAKLANLHVTATCGTRNLDLVKSLGADEVIDYTTPEGKNLKSPSDLKYDLAINCASGTTWSTLEPNLAADGKVIDVAPGFGSFMTSIFKKLTFSRKQLVPLMMLPKGEKLEFLVGLAKDGKVKTLIDSRYPFSEVEGAWTKCMEGHATGKIVVEVDRE